MQNKAGESMKLLILVFLGIIFPLNVMAQDKVNYSLADLLLVDKDLGVASMNVTRMADFVEAHIALDTLEVKQASNAKKVNLTLEQVKSISKIMLQMHEIIGPEKSPFNVNNSKISLGKKEYNIYVYIIDIDVQDYINIHFNHIFSGLSKTKGSLKDFKKWIIERASGNNKCFSFNVRNKESLRGGLIFSKYRQDNKHLNCVERGFLKLIGLVGNKKQLSDLSPKSLEWRVLRDLYSTDIFMYKTYDELLNMSMDYN